MMMMKPNSLSESRVNPTMATTTSATAKVPRMFVPLTVMLSVYTWCFAVLYSGMGVGVRFYIAVHHHEWASGALFMGSIVVLWMMFVCDGFTGGRHFFEHKGRIVATSTALLALLIGIILGIDSYPYGPFCLFVLFLVPTVAVLPHFLCYHETDFFIFLGRLSRPCTSCGAIVGLAWLYWSSAEKNRWSKARERYGVRLRENGFDCRRTYEENWMDDADLDGLEPFGRCTEVFLIWVLPWIMAWALAVFSLVLKVISPGDDPIPEVGAEGTTTTKNKKKKAPQNRVFLALTFLLIGAWVAASLAGAGHGIGAAIFASVVAAAIGLGFAACYAFGFKGLWARLAHNRNFQESLNKYYSPYADAWRGLFLVSLGPLVLIFYIPTVLVKQRVRALKQCCCCSCCTAEASKKKKTKKTRVSLELQGGFVGAPPSVENFDLDVDREEEDCHSSSSSENDGDFDERKYWLTREARGMWESAAEWNWTKVYQWAALVGLANIAVVVVVAKFTVLLMSYVVVACEELSVLQATLVIVGVGMFLFLLPPIPGAPIYLAAGVLLVAVCRSKGWPVILGITYSATVSLGIKLSACALQQKLIGAPLAKSLWVRKTVGINSDLIRCTRLVLADEGMTMGKVALLVGGPDWPTSVLCGILKLPLLPVLLGTTPVWFLIWPTCLGGAFLIIDEPTSQVLSTIFVGLAALVQSGSLVVAAIQLRQEQVRRKDQIDAIPLDPEVEAAAAMDKMRKEIYDTQTHWSRVPRFYKTVLTSAIVFLTVACWATTCYPSACFRDFAVNDRVSKRLQGNWTRIIKPLGLVALLCAFLAALLCMLFEWGWASRQVNNHLAKQGGGGALGHNHHPAAALDEHKDNRTTAPPKFNDVTLSSQIDFP